MARYKRTNVQSHYKRVKGKFKKVEELRNTDKGKNPTKVTDEQIVMAEKDPEKREQMFRAMQQGKTKRALYRNLTTQGISAGGQASSSVVATKALSQNINGGTKTANNGREDPEDEPDPEDPIPPVY